MVQIFSTWVGIAKIESLNIEEAISYAKKLEYLPKKPEDNVGDTTVTQRFLNDPIFEKVKREIEDLTHEYVKLQGHIIDDVKVTSSWGNLLKKGEPINVHNHPNSYVSGVFYLTDASPLNFHNPTNQEDLFTFRPLSEWDANNPYTWQVLQIKPKPGYMFLFPSKLNHHVECNEDDFRYSVAFNTLPVVLRDRGLCNELSVKTIK